MPVLELLFRFLVAERAGIILISALVAHTSWHWMVERYDVLSQYSVTWTALASVLLISILPWLVGMLAAAAAARAAVRYLRRRGPVGGAAAADS